MISGIVAIGHANRGRHDYRPAYTLVSLLPTRLNPQSPRPAMIRIAFGGPTCSERMPIITTPTGPVPMHIVTIPITRDRAAGGASVRIRVVCMFEKAAVPSPPTSNSTKASAYHGDRAKPRTRCAKRLLSWYHKRVADGVLGAERLVALTSLRRK